MLSRTVMWKKGNVPNELNVLDEANFMLSFKSDTCLLLAVHSKIQTEEKSYFKNLSFFSQGKFGGNINNLKIAGLKIKLYHSPSLQKANCSQIKK